DWIQQGVLASEHALHVDTCRADQRRHNNQEQQILECVGCRHLSVVGEYLPSGLNSASKEPASATMFSHSDERRRVRQRRSATADQISSTTPNGHAPCRKP